jgi:hypothetical protein
LAKNAPKYGAEHKSSCLKYAVKLQQKFWRNRRASFAPFTLFGQICALHNLISELDSWWYNIWEQGWRAYPSEAHFNAPLKESAQLSSKH